MAGHEVRGLSRHDHADASSVRWHRGDLLEGSGIDEAVAGVDVILHCATQATGDKDVHAARHLVDAARRAGVGHLIYVSIVGTDRIPLPYYKTKLQVEQIVTDSGVGHTVQRATQFHDLVKKICSAQRFSPVLLALRGVRFQPIDTRDVAIRLVELIASEPAGRAPDIGGPAVHTHAELARMYLKTRRSRRRVAEIALPGRVVAGYRSGANLAPENAIGAITFQEFLSDTE